MSDKHVYTDDVLTHIYFQELYKPELDTLNYETGLLNLIYHFFLSYQVTVLNFKYFIVCTQPM